MRVIVDTNILFSACLTPSGRIFKILSEANFNVDFLSVYFALDELQNHRQKLMRLSRHTEEDMGALIITVLSFLNLFDEGIIERKYWEQADLLTQGVDNDDISFVALTLQTNGLLWTGDKKLAEHLKSLGFDRVVSTAELHDMLHL